MARPKKIKEVETHTLTVSEMADIHHADIHDDAPKAKGATVTFIGDPRGGADPAFPEYGGMSFPKGKAVPVDAEWLKANGNVRKNNHFKVE